MLTPMLMFDLINVLTGSENQFRLELKAVDLIGVILHCHNHGVILGVNIQRARHLTTD